MFADPFLIYHKVICQDFFQQTDRGGFRKKETLGKWTEDVFPKGFTEES